MGLPDGLAEIMPNLEILNLNNNKIGNVFQVVDTLVPLSKLHTLLINLVTEEEVDYVLKHLSGLVWLNGLGVDREELNAAATQSEGDF